MVDIGPSVDPPRGKRRGPTEPPINRPFLYFMVAMESGRVKIGIAHNPRMRVIKIQTGCPEEVRLCGWLHPPNAKAVEAELHAKFSAEWLRGEWFEWSDAINAYVTDHLSHDWDLMDATIELVRRKRRDA